MSDRLLKESDVMRAIDKRVEELSNDPVFVRKKGYIDVLGIKRHILAIPSADRPQGKWKAKSFHEFICDNCGFSFDMMKCDFLKNMKYCPNCGVRKGADDE